MVSSQLSQYMVMIILVASTCYVLYKFQVHFLHLYFLANLHNRTIIQIVHKIQSSQSIRIDVIR